MKSKMREPLRKKLAAVGAGLLLSVPAIGIAQWSEIRACEAENLIRAAGEPQVKAFSVGPGFDTLPYSDSYGSYQWALLNNGLLKLVPNSRMTLEYAFQAWAEGQKPHRGPALEEGHTTISVQGIDLNILPAWKKYDEKTDKRQVVVALVDTGVEYSHPDLADSIWVNEDEIADDGIDNDGNGYIDDVYGWNFYSDNNQVSVGSEDNHGTHSAGTIAAGRENGGIIGICDPAYVKIMVVKALGTADGIGTADHVAEAIRYAEANGASICNLSFGTGKYSEELYQTMKNSKMLFVVAAGNGDSTGKGYDIDQKPVYPASFGLDNIISVANLQFDGQLDAASNYDHQLLLDPTVYGTFQRQLQLTSYLHPNQGFRFHHLHG